MKKHLHLTLTTLVIAMVNPCGAQMHLWSISENGNDHFYETVIVPGGISWTDANSLAQQAGGHLVTLNSASENEFVYSIINHEDYWDGGSGPWIGAYQPSGSVEPAGGWRWVTDEPFHYTHWHETQPNEFTNSNESRVQYRYGNWWNDVQDSFILGSTLVVSFIIEYDVMKTDRLQWDYGDSGNGHSYLAVSMMEGISWSQANLMSNKMEGYLATVTSTQESMMIQGLVSDPAYWETLSTDSQGGPWLGGYQLPGSIEPDGGWLWSIAEPFVYTDWAPGLPDNKPGADQNANCLHLLKQRSSRYREIVWNDMPQDSVEITSFIVEFPLYGPPLLGDLNYDGIVDDHDQALWDIIKLEYNLSPE